MNKIKTLVKIGKNKNGDDLYVCYCCSRKTSITSSREVKCVYCGVSK